RQQDGARAEKPRRFGDGNAVQGGRVTLLGQAQRGSQPSLGRPARARRSRGAPASNHLRMSVPQSKEERRLQGGPRAVAAGPAAVYRRRPRRGPPAVVPGSGLASENCDGPPAPPATTAPTAHQDRTVSAIAVRSSLAHPFVSRSRSTACCIVR